MSYSPARLDEATPAETAAKPGEKPEAETPVPSWFTPGTEIVKPDQLAERYRERLAREQAMQKAQDEELEAYRRKLDEKFKAAQRLYDHPGNDNPSHSPQVNLRARRPTLPVGQIELQSARYHREAEQEKPAQAEPAPITLRKRKTQPATPVRARRKREFHIGTYVAYAAIAVVIGGGAGYGFANRATLSGWAQSGLDHARRVVADLARPLPEGGTDATIATSPGGTTTIAKKPVAMAQLQVNDVRGTLNSMIPLTLSATAASDKEPVDVVISGLPPSAYLTAGQQSADGSWVVKAPDLANVRLVVAQSEEPKLNLEVAAVEQTTGSLAAPAQKMQVELADVKIVPTAAPPDSQFSAVQIKPAEVPAPDGGAKQASALPAAVAPGGDLLSKADALMAQGDVISARQLYLQAANLGNAKGAFGVARTYDPKVFAELKIDGLQPDPAKAAEWYKKAQAAGMAANP
ncbi:MAG: hypothetical protein KGO53_09210 [Alphaproteobacteria bacterium]|nr:hypothetical protein [Alphaproteobacteria bacterium]